MFRGEVKVCKCGWSDVVGGCVDTALTAPGSGRGQALRLADHRAFPSELTPLGQIPKS